MKRLRIFWIVVVVIAAAIFGTYRYNEIRKEDSSGPVFSCEEQELAVSIQDGEEVLLQGITAKDKKDGDVTDSILVEKLSSFYGENKRLVTYAAFDSDNHVSEMEREITYKDYTSPRFGLNGSLRFRAGEKLNIDEIITVQDCLDGDLSRKVKIKMDESINNRMTGFYDIEYQVTNSAGDTATLPLRFEIYQSDNYEVEMNLSQYLVYYEGEEIDFKDYLKSIRMSGMEYPFEGVMLEGMKELGIVIPESIEEETETATETEESAEEIAAEEEQAEEEETEGETEETVSEAEEPENTITFIPKSRVTVRSSVNYKKPGVYPVYFDYRDPQERFDYTATEVMYVVVE